jgi:hypothetical protein
VDGGVGGQGREVDWVGSVEQRTDRGSDGSVGNGLDLSGYWATGAAPDSCRVRADAHQSSSSASSLRIVLGIVRLIE